ncbi:hypothetical protein AZ037_002669 [Klebsiella michiganensis]|nr:hypothetical protein AZ037_002669 [Klebsiella michiganensis]
MSKGFVLIGDKTTHGGQVISASSKIEERPSHYSKKAALQVILMRVIS